MQTLVKLMLAISILTTVGCTQTVTAKAIGEAERLCKEFGGLSHISIDPMSGTTRKHFYQVNCINEDRQFSFRHNK